ncbi:response regulator [Nocardioides sp. LHG3406-4]|uniref:response regulator n=1 Tax=Nocardioides sp. LHG3406-4 TaxID=2804575 RepID=UPI003CEA8FB4
MGTHKILVVEDNALNMKLMRDVLEHAGFEVVGAGTGEEGVRLAGEVAPDLVLMDLQLPGMDGTEAFRRIRAAGATELVPIVAVTASAMPADRDAASAAGFDGFLEKPVSVRALPAQVSSYLKKSAS